jgi:aminoglycoside phosphotransferase (APT) family kinase protein
VSRLSEVERIFARHRLGAVRLVEPLPGGQLNTALRVNRTHVLRYREASVATGSLIREVAVLKLLAGRVPAPEVEASGIDDILGEYVIHKWIPGQNLLQAWLENPDVAVREWWIREWIAAVQGIHEERFPRCGELPHGELKEYPTWRGYIEARVRKRLDLLMRIPTSDRALVLTTERYLRRQAPVLEDGPFCLVHRDLHFANVLVEGPRVAAIVDFELAEVGTPDYELDTIFRFLRYPWLFAPPEQASRVTPARFASVWIRLKRGYPEMFNVRYLRERLCLYALDHDLSCLIQAYSGRWGESGVEVTLRRIGDILQGRYGPE